MTNREKLNKMSDEEFAEIVCFNECVDRTRGYECPANAMPNVGFMCGYDCKKAFIAWLREEANEDGA